MSGMIEKIKERLELHGAVLQRFPKPGYLMILSCIITMLISWIYPIIVYKIAYLQMMGQYLFQDFIIRHADAFGMGQWLMPMTVLIGLWLCCLGLHQRNIEKYIH